MKPNMQDSDTFFKSAEDVYCSIAEDQHRKGDAELLIDLRDWFINVCDFDPRTGQALPNDLGAFLNNIRKSVSADHDGVPKDRLSRIVDHSGDSIKSIIANPRDAVHRAHAIMPIYAAREVDSTSVQWLSRKPGRTLRDKLSGKPYIKAVNRRMCVDTSENRLLKAFITRLEQFLLARNDAFAEDPQGYTFELLQLITRWFQDSETQAIGSWSNLPPNNTLLQDKNYRKVWDAWLWLQALDENIYDDHTRLRRDVLTAIFWTILSSVDHIDGVRILQQPCYFDYDDYNIIFDLNIQGMYYPHLEKAKDTLNGRKREIDPKGNEDLPGWLKIEFNCPSKDEFEVRVGLKSVIVNCQSQESIRQLLNNEGDRRDLQFDYGWPAIKAITDESLSFLFGNYNTRISDQEGDDQELPVSCNEMVLDLGAPRPKYTADLDSEKKLPFRLVRQYWDSDSYGRVGVDCGTTSGIMLRPEVTTISILSLFSENASFSTGVLSNAAMEFTRNISNYLKPEKLTYLVPDAINEFSLENIRRSLNFYFPESAPLPRSIAGIFAWQASKGFMQSDIQQGDIVLVTENSFAGIVLTPVVGFVSPELSESLPESKGVHWERHPSMVIKGDSVVDVVKRVLDKEDWPLSQEIADLFGFTGLTDELDSLSWIDPEMEWYSLPSDFRDRLRQEVGQNRIQSDDIDKAIKTIPGKRKKNNVFLLPLDNSFKKPKKKDSNIWLGSAWSLTKGGQTLNEWQLKAGDIPLWRDHLPELSIRVPIDGRWGQFFLVKEATVTPQKGKKVRIPVKESFTLRSGKPHYQFPLLQGTGGQELHYMAYLKSSAFPLQKDTVCNLKMTYTYGADDSYELNFIPKHPNKARFNSIRVEWRELRHSNTAELMFPGFPDPHEWEELKTFPRKNGRPSDLFEWIKQELGKVRSIAEFGRCKGIIESEFREDRYGKKFWFADDDTFLHQNSFEAELDELPSVGDVVTYYKIKNHDGKFQGVDITVGNVPPRKCFLTRNLRFPVLTVWDHAHSLSEVQVPDRFRQIIQEGVKDALYLISRDDTYQNLKDELFFFLSCLHKDTPNEVSSTLMKILQDSETSVRPLEHYFRNIAYSIGDCTMEWQIRLLEKVLFFIKGNDSYRSTIGLQVLSIAIWRTEQLIFRFSQKEIHLIVENLLASLEDGLYNLIKNSSWDNSVYVNSYEIIKLEFLLALLRTRGSQDQCIKMILSPEKEITRKFVAIVDDITQKICDKNLELQSRVSLEVEKPPDFHNTPDLLYALRMYLTGDSGANAIQVTGVIDVD
jgi:hypothetical protein